ncbi:MAG: diguanylate cyclase, partial [Candidatus Acidiferrum sp.]
CRVLVANAGALTEGNRVPVSISIGATLMVGGDSAESVVKRADQLMYASKSDGRNRTTIG